ncbi:phosphoadenylyl-sulfate reductase [Bacillus salipaludis]|uniref:Adenosine 5'-phosphosulfate reductase n=1 Tax=Bacillus salipaludis TaxID=2547811 RepID=A0A4R5VP14_9BACI|nr:phosphoadenylyl-sulfate reductase [Bacillus salipaludis]MDQ6595731.1 phosphoadenylyl-sulfate reductase [Bacillus salipaludis]TDK59928.1 phosphoadenylyl-sulfate reductase [Bacillus salipaludis]
MTRAVTYENWNQISDSFQTEDETKGARAVLEWAYQNYSEDKIVYASSFGAEAIVLIDLIQQVKPDAHIVFLDTGLHFPETYDVIDKIEARFPSLRIERKQPVLNLDEQREQYGSALWKKDPNLCCQIRKVIPLRETLTTKEAWISGLRREQSPTRKDTQFLNKDEKFENIKICPLIHWTWDEVWAYIREKDLPYNQLHDQNYPSIGCFPCTQPVAADGDSRAGRWSGSGKTECGLHTK